MLCHWNLIPSFCFVLSNHYMPLYVLLCGPKIRNKYLISCIFSKDLTLTIYTVLGRLGINIAVKQN